MSKKNSKDKAQPTELEVLEQKCQEFETGWKRALADYDNLKKDLLREKQQMRDGTVKQICEELLPVLDNFDQAVRHQPEGTEENVQSWLSGILHVRSQLEDVLKSFGAEPFGKVGDVFDPHLHEAVSELTDETQKDEVILELMQRGWRLQEIIIRPARVIINNLNKETN